MTLQSGRILWHRFYVVLGVLGVDQITKGLMQKAFEDADAPWMLFSWFRLVSVWNTGVSFGMMQGMEGWFHYGLIAIILLGVGVCLWWVWRTPSIWEGYFWAGTLGGALGNIIDRLRWGAVFDFIEWSYGVYVWPAFNVADVAISVCGVCLFVKSLFFRETQTKKGTRG